MRKQLTIVLLLLSFFASAQKIIEIDISSSNWGTFRGTITVTPNDFDPSDTLVVIPPTTTSNKVTFSELIGINGNIQLASDGKMGDLLREKASIFSNCRTFYLVEHDLHGVPLNQRFPKPSLSECGSISQGWSDGNAAWKQRFCQLDAIFPVNILSPEAIYYPDGKGSTLEKKYPNKALSLSDLGGEPYKTGKKYGDLWKKSLSNQVDYTEVWNEPHGTPSKVTLQGWAQGLHDALEGSGIKLMSSDRTASGVETYQGKQINTWIGDCDTSLVEAISCHSYSFDRNFKLTIAPEEKVPGYFSTYQEIKDLANWNKGAKELFLTEFGFSSEQSEEIQSAYIMRTIFHAMRYGFTGIEIYQLQDEPWAWPFNHCGILNQDGSEKSSYKMLVFWIVKYGDYYFDKVIEEDGSNFNYQFTSGEKTIQVSWNVMDLSFPTVKEL